MDILYTKLILACVFLLLDHKYEEPSDYEPLRRNPLQNQNDDHDYQSLTTSQEGK